MNKGGVRMFAYSRQEINEEVKRIKDSINADYQSQMVEENHPSLIG